MLRGTTLNSHGIAVPHCAQNNGVRSVTGLFFKNSPMPLQDHVPQVVCRPLSPDRALFLASAVRTLLFVAFVHI